MKQSKILIISSEFPPLPGGIGSHALNLGLHLNKEGKKVSALSDHRSENSNDDMQSNPKILQIIDTLGVGGAEKVFVDMCNILEKNKQNITALFLLKVGVLKSQLNQNIHTIELHRNQKWSIKKMHQCATILKQFDIIHCHCRHVYKYIKLVDLLFFTNLKIIFQDHYGITNVSKEVPLFFNSILKPKYYIGVSNNSINWCKAYLKVNPRNVFLLENIIIKENIDNSKIKNSHDLILVSNIKSNKNNLFAIELAKKSNKSLRIVGKIQDIKYNNILLDSIQNISNTIDFESNINNVQSVLNTAKLGLHTSLYETGPLVLIEYLSQGLPFLAYETGEVARMLKPHFSEYFIDNFEINKWEIRINLLLNQTPDYEKMKAVFEKYFGEQQYFDKLNAIYQCIEN